MQILAIESAAMTAGVALINEEKVVAEYTVDLKKTHSQTLLPMIDEIVAMTGTDLNDLDAIAISEGPGSFTGLRIGSSTAKGLGLALKKPLIPVPTLAAMAYQCWGSNRLICPIMDARRGQVYTGLYRFDQQGNMETVEPQQIIMLTELTKMLEDKKEKMLFLGDAVPLYKEELKLALPDCTFAPAHLGRQRAASVGTLGMLLFEQGVQQTAAEHVPCYMRKSQAEREKEKMAAAAGETYNEPEVVTTQYGVIQTEDGLAAKPRKVTSL